MAIRSVVLLRHGESVANADDRFAGWLDPDLTAEGREQARAAGRLLADRGLAPEVVHTSVLVRAVRTATELLAELNGSGVPLHRCWRLNERHYGALQGLRREDARLEFGAGAVSAWRRSYSARPPLSPDAGDALTDPRYAQVPTRDLPRGESLADVRARVVPYWQDRIHPSIRRGRVPLVVAHGNTLRALIMYLDDLAPDRVGTVQVPTGVPLVYHLDADGRPVRPGGSFLVAGASIATSAGMQTVTRAGTTLSRGLRPV